MRPLPFGSALVISVLLLHSGTASAQMRPDATNGRMLFEAYCAPCHGTDGKGHGSIAAELRDAPPDLTALKARYDGTYPAALVERFVTDGTGALSPAHAVDVMPKWGPTLNSFDTSPSHVKDSIRAIVSYLETLQTGNLGSRSEKTTVPTGELDRLVAPIALYPDALLARVLTASSFSTDIPAASGWADAHRRLEGARLAAAMADEPLPWDISIEALIPFRPVLNEMALDMSWTSELGTAFLADREGVMSAVQRLRRRAASNDLLRACPALILRNETFIEIAPADPAYIVIPVYDPLAVFETRVTGRSTVSCGTGVRLDAWFAAWGWNRLHLRRSEPSGESGHRGARDN